MALTPYVARRPNIGVVHPTDTKYTNIFIGGLPHYTTDDKLARFFQQFGQVLEANVITDNEGKSRGYGFVIMADAASAERACNNPNPIIDGRKAGVNLAYLGAKTRVPSWTHGAGGHTRDTETITSKERELNLLKIEMANLKEEKRKTEERLMYMMSEEKELVVIREVNSLRHELEEQSSQLQNNQLIVQALQDQISRLQQEPKPQQKSTVSRLCIIQ